MLVPLDWDQRHTLSGTATYHPNKSSGLSLVFNLGSGLPIQLSLLVRELHLKIMVDSPQHIILMPRAFYHFSLSKTLKVSFNINV